MKIRILIPLVFSGLFLIALGCIGTDPITGENKTAMAEKKSVKMIPVEPHLDDAEKYVPGQVLIKLKEGMDASALDILSLDLGLEIIKPLALPGVYLMQITGNDSVIGMVERLKVYDMIEYSEPNYKLNVE